MTYLDHEHSAIPVPVPISIFQCRWFWLQHNHLLRRFPLFRLATASDFFIPYDRLKREQSMCFYDIVSMLNSHMENESIHFLRNVIV